jgi:hypothetical protein
MTNYLVILYQIQKLLSVELCGSTQSSLKINLRIALLQPGLETGT